jgi:hypothetical protein
VYKILSLFLHSLSVPLYELAAPPRRSGRYGPAKGGKKKEEEDDGGQTRCVCNQQRTYPLLHSIHFSIRLSYPSTLLYNPTLHSSHIPTSYYLLPFLPLTGLSNGQNVLIRHGTKTPFSVPLMSSLPFRSHSRGSRAAARE